MNDNIEFSFINLPELTRDEKREIWLRRTGHTVAVLAAVAGVVPNVLSRYLRDKYMPVKYHAALIEYGVPTEVLPPPGVCKNGRPARVPLPLNAGERRPAG